MVYDEWLDTYSNKEILEIVKDNPNEILEISDVETIQINMECGFFIHLYINENGNQYVEITEWDSNIQIILDYDSFFKIFDIEKMELDLSSFEKELEDVAPQKRKKIYKYDGWINLY